MDVHIRQAGPRDAPEVMRLIQALAQYEEAPQEVVLNVEELARDLAGKAPAQPIVWLAYWNHRDRPSGMAFCFWAYSTWKGPTLYLEDLFVEASYRRLGIGRALLECVIDYSIAHQARRLAWQVLDWNQLAIAFYRALGAELDPSWVQIRLQGAELERMKNRRLEHGKSDL